MLPGRTDNAIKNHWNSALRRELRKLNRMNSAIIPALAGGIDAAGRVEHVAAKLRQQQKGARVRNRPGSNAPPGSEPAGADLPTFNPPDAPVAPVTDEDLRAREAVFADATAAAAMVMDGDFDAAQDAAVAAVVASAVRARAWQAAMAACNA